MRRLLEHGFELLIKTTLQLFYGKGLKFFLGTFSQRKHYHKSWGNDKTFFWPHLVSHSQLQASLSCVAYMSHHVMSWLLPLDSNSVLNYICYHTGQLNSLFETLHDQDGKKKPIWKIFCASVWQQECFPQILILLINFGIINKKQFSTVKQSCSLNSSSRRCCDGYSMWCNGWKDYKEHLIFHIAVLHETLRYPWNNGRNSTFEDCWGSTCINQTLYRGCGHRGVNCSLKIFCFVAHWMATWYCWHRLTWDC